VRLGWPKAFFFTPILWRIAVPNKTLPEVAADYRVSRWMSLLISGALSLASWALVILLVMCAMREVIL
jgi:hypothetical protein